MSRTEMIQLVFLLYLTLSPSWGRLIEGPREEESRESDGRQDHGGEAIKRILTEEKSRESDGHQEHEVEAIKRMLTGQDKHGQSKRGIAAIIGATAGAISAGASVASLASSWQYSVECHFDIENYTKWPMTWPHLAIISGQVEQPPVPVQPGTKEAVVTHKSGGATGSYGTVSWDVEGQRVIVMWSAPYNFNHYSNTLAVGFITSGGHYHSIADSMYYDGRTHDSRRLYNYGKYTLKYSYAEYYYHTPTIESCYEKLCIQGIMGTAHHADVKIIVFPRTYDDLAQSVKNVVKSGTWL